MNKRNKEKLDERKTQKCFFRKRFSFEKYGRGKERSKKKTKFFQNTEESKKDQKKGHKTNVKNK